MKVDKATEKIHSCLAEVNAQIGILLHQRVYQIDQSNKELLAGISKLRTDNTQLLTEMGILQTKNDELLDGMRRNEASVVQHTQNQDREDLEEFSRRLGHVARKYEDHDLCKKALVEIFPGAFDGNDNSSPGWSERYVQMTPSLLNSSSEYQNWKACSSPCLLVIGGLTESEGQASQSTYSWLSPASSHIVDQLGAEGKRAAYFSCHPDMHLRHVSSHLIVSSLLRQLLTWHSNILRNRVKEFSSIVHSKEWDAEDQNEALECQFKLLERVAKELPAQEETFIILDRIDLCDCASHNLVAALQHLIRNSHSLLKVAVAMERVWNSNDWYECRDVVKSNNICYTLARMNWDQGRRSS